MNGSKPNRGGKRPGAGRPKGDGKIYSFRVPGDIAKLLDGQENRTEFIRRSIENELKHSRKGEPVGEIVPAADIRPLHLPYFDVRVVAGFPVPLDNDERSQDIDMLRLLCPHPEASYLIRVNGDSMIDAGIMSGDIVIVDKSRRDPSPKEIAVCELNGEYTLKHFAMEDGRGWLIPANPDYPKIPVNDGDAFSVWGTVTYIIHKARE